MIAVLLYGLSNGLRRVLGGWGMGERFAHFGEGFEQRVKIAQDDGLDAGEGGEFSVPDIEDERGAAGGVEILELLEEELRLDVLLDGEDARFEGRQTGIAPEGGGEHIDEKLLEGIPRLKPGACSFENRLQEAGGFAGDEDVREERIGCLFQASVSFALRG